MTAAARSVLCVAIGALVLAVPGAARAEPPPDSAAVPVGDTARAMPGIARVGVPGPRTSWVALAATAGYGLTEAQADQPGSNHRAAGTLAIGVAPVAWLDLGLCLDGRYDAHPKDADGADSGGVGEPRLIARVGQRWGAVAAGAELAAWLPGGDAPAANFAATTVDGRGLFAVSPGAGATTLAAALGYRLDNSAEVDPEADRLRVGDRVALGLSDFDALLLGVGLSQRWGATELLGEVSADWLLGSDAPGLDHSPVRVTAGVRYALSPRLALEALTEAVPTARPSIAQTAALTPIEPRFSFYLGLRARLRPLSAPVAPPPPVEPPAPVVTTPPPVVVAPPPVVVAPPEPVLCAVSGVVLDESGAPIVDAEAKAKVGERELAARTDASGRFTLRGEACGAGELGVSAVDFDPVTRAVQLLEAEAPEVEIRLLPAVPAGELRGLVRALDGAPIAAEIRVVGTDKATTTAADGSFTLQVPPGSYTVVIDAAGFRQQRRAVKIDNRGVTILNADLQSVP